MWRLAIGWYTVSASKQGFKKFAQTGIGVRVDENRQVAVVLQIGGAAESVTVSADAAGHVERGD